MRNKDESTVTTCTAQTTIASSYSSSLLQQEEEIVGMIDTSTRSTTQQERREHVKFIHLIWMQSSCDTCDANGISAMIADKLFNGQMDALGLYLTGLYMFDDDDHHHHHCISINEGDFSNDYSLSSTTTSTDTDADAKTETTNTNIDIIASEDLSYQDFVQTYMMPNKPVVITGCTTDWKSTKEWITPDPFSSSSTPPTTATATTTTASTSSRMVPDMDHLARQFGQDVITVHIQPSTEQMCMECFNNNHHHTNYQHDNDSNRTDNEHHSSSISSGFQGVSTQRRKKDITLQEYADWWMDHHLHLLIQSEQQEQQKITTDTATDDTDTATTATNGNDISPIELLYMKDWQFVVQHPQESYYQTPSPYFTDDWLNGSTGMGSAYKFCYLGPAGTVTPLHADVLNSYSWSSNVCGVKRWYLVPPEKTYLLYNVFGTKLAPHMHADILHHGMPTTTTSSSTANNHDTPPSNSKYNNNNNNTLGECLYPGLKEARKYMKCITQQEGESIFVPSGWHHTVENLQPTLSINHNWINGVNILWSWDKIVRQYQCLNWFESQMMQHGTNNSVVASSPTVTSSTQSSSSQSSSPSSVISPASISLPILSQDQDKSMEQNSGDSNSTNDDDLYLLWLVLSSKAKDILKEENKGNSSMQKEIGNEEWIDWTKFNLERILFILQKMKTLQYGWRECHTSSSSNNSSMMKDKSISGAYVKPGGMTGRINYKEVEILIDEIKETLANH